MIADLLRYVLLAFLILSGNQIYAKVYLVSIGVADYSGYPFPANSLDLPVKNAKTITGIYLVNGDLDYSMLENDKASKENIISEVERIFSKAGADDIVVFYFCGHGFPGGICAYNGDLTYDQVRKAMAKSKSKNKMMFLDTCFSGSLRGKGRQNVDAGKAAGDANVLLFLSSRTDEYSMERTDMNNSFFTTYLQKGLRGNADANKDRIITAKELYNFVHKGVIKISGDMQHPVMWGKFNHDMPVMKW